MPGLECQSLVAEFECASLPAPKTWVRNLTITKEVVPLLVYYHLLCTPNMY